MPSSDHWKIRDLQANGLRFQAYDMGSGPLVLALHGFPDTPATFHQQFPALVAAGYRVVAPFLRGYAPSDVSPQGPYEVAALIQDVIAIIDQLTSQPAFVIGHDLGAAAAHGAAILAPERIKRLVTMALPHGGAFSRALMTNPAQQRRSWYMYFFQMAFAEMAISFNDFAFIDRLWQEWSPGWRFALEEIAPVKETLRQPGVLKAALTYYRTTLNPALQSPALADVRRRQAEPVPVPTLYLHGAQDGCIGVELVEGLEKAFLQPLEKRILPGAGHFVHRECPQDVNALILGFFSRD